MRFEPLTRDGVMKWRWLFAIRRLRDAYEASRSALDKTLQAIDREDAKRIRHKPDTADREEVESYEAWVDHLIDRHEEAVNALEAIRQGFAVILYHSWEKHAVQWTDWPKRYHHGHVTGRLKKMGYVVDSRIHKLGKVANTIKHDSDDLWKEDRSMFRETLGEMMKNGVLSGYARNLQITDDQMDGFFNAMLASGYPGPATPTL